MIQSINPGKKYERTRHNIGFRVVDAFVNNFSEKWEEKKKYHGLLATVRDGGNTIYCLKPQTFMNISGKALSAFLKYHSVDKMLVIYDDKDMAFGKIRFRSTGASGGHNGMKSLFAALGSQELARIKVGVKNEHTDLQDTADFVLSSFTKDEEAELPAIIQEALEKVTEYISE